MGDDSSETTFSERFSKIPDRLRVRVLYDDSEYIVVDKPCNLRSVPGHANPPPPPHTKRKRGDGTNDDESTETAASLTTTSALAGSNRLTGQESWLLAIQSFELDQSEASGFPDACIQRLAAHKSLASSAPRRYKLFRRYVERNQRRLFPLGIASELAGGDNKPHQREPSELMEEAAKAMYERIQERQQPLMNLPEPTKYEDSAWGQLILMGYGSDNKIKSQRGNLNDILIVHRLDCETSGLMVFAKTEEAAASLCRDWRERNVSKTYMAHVRRWPPLHKDKLMEGTIDLPLIPSDERLKWKVSSSLEIGSKPSTTIWKVRPNNHSDVKHSDAAVVTLHLFPVTGRTHQLRIHCAHVGSGIIGDSLYGEDQIRFNPDGGSCLHLHASNLEFPHPRSRTPCSFSSNPPWL